MWEVFEGCNEVAWIASADYEKHDREMEMVRRHTGYSIVEERDGKSTQTIIEPLHATDLSRGLRCLKSAGDCGSLSLLFVRSQSCRDTHGEGNSASALCSLGWPLTLHIRSRIPFFFPSFFTTHSSIFHTTQFQPNPFHDMSDNGTAKGKGNRGGPAASRSDHEVVSITRSVYLQPSLTHPSSSTSSVPSSSPVSRSIMQEVPHVPMPHTCLSVQNALAPAGRNAHGFKQKIWKINNAYRADIDAIKNVEPLESTTTDTPTPKQAAGGRKRKAKTDDDANGDAETPIKKRGRPKKNVVSEPMSETIVMDEPEGEQEIEAKIAHEM